MKRPPRGSQKRATVLDVARAAGVSAGTVSNMLSGKRNVDGATRQRIEAAIQTLGYVPNLAARRMRTGRSNAIAIFSSMPIAVAAGASKLGFLMEIAASAAVTALESNAALTLIPPIEDPVKALDTIAMDGALIVEPEAEDAVLARLTRSGIPTVSIGKPPSGEGAYVDLDYHAMAQLLFSHLLACGARNFPLVVGQSQRQTNTVFKQVYGDMAAQAGMTSRILEVSEKRAEDGAAEAIAQELDNGKTLDAVLVPIDAMATGVMRALRQAGLDVPGEVRVVTRYDGVRARSEQPPLTALDLRLDDVAVIATRALAGLIETGEGPTVIPAPAPTLIARASSTNSATIESRN
ncbi:MAG: substrate-binding domain-containing protein [Rhodospirillaceae bacterium]